MSNTSASLPHIDADSHCLPPNATLADVITFHNNLQGETKKLEASMQNLQGETKKLEASVQNLQERISRLEVFVKIVQDKKASKSTHRHNTTPQWPVATATKSRE